ncbi:helix-turn-helix transcriptional regulator [Millisia brevis]|uniref:helix-turn-helix transcriptional regulator n=1 Tax=Millisia brevis TaxID=264148 RepID=UPI000834E194|nr:helix-turn-helix transcriptional regulator [Millisia brevis]
MAESGNRVHSIDVPADDYRRAFDIISDCHDAPTVDAFREALAEALVRRLGVENLSVFSGSTFNLVFEDSAPLTRGATARMLPEYQDRWAAHDIFGTPVAVRHLMHSSVATLDELTAGGRLPAAANAYVRHFLDSRWRMASAAALRLPLVGGRTALVGMFGRTPEELSPRTITVLRLVGQQLAPLTKRLPLDPQVRTVARLTDRQRDVLRLVADGRSNAQIAEVLCIAEDSVKKYVTRILHQTGCHSRLELALIARDAAL